MQKEGKEHLPSLSLFYLHGQKYTKFALCLFTLQCLGPILLDHDAELQDQLGRRLQEGLQQPQHVDVSILEHHGPVPTTLMLLLPSRHDAQVEGPNVPAGVRGMISLGKL